MDYICIRSKNNLKILSANPKAQYSSYKEEINIAIQRVLDSGWYVLGNEVELFEKEFSKYNNVAHTIGVGSGTEALHIGLRALGIGVGDEVITTSHTAVATASAIHLAGAMPIFVDIEPSHFSIDPNQIEAAISPKTKAIIAVHIYGHPCDMDSIMEIAKKYSLKVIEDCAQAHGAEYKKMRVGSIGDIGCFSFYPTKNLGAIGDGGAIVANDDSLADKLRLLREYGWEKRYISSQEGWNSRLDEIQAAVLRVKLKQLDKDNKKRQKLASLYQKNLSQLPIELPNSRKNSSHVYHLFVVKTTSRDRLKKFLYKKEIGSTIQYPCPIHKQDYFTKIVGDISLPITEKAAMAILSLPMYPELKIEIIDYISKQIELFHES